MYFLVHRCKNSYAKTRKRHFICYFANIRSILFSEAANSFLSKFVPHFHCEKVIDFSMY